MSSEPEVVGNGEERGEEELPRMTLLDHLDELRRRILYSIIAIFVAFLASWYFAPEIFHWLEKPFLAAVPEGEKLAFTDLPGPFMLYIKVALLTAIFVASPVLLVQLWLFLRPGLYKKERRLFAPFVIFTTLFFVAGGYFGYLVAFPMVVKFLLGVGEGFDAVEAVSVFFCEGCESAEFHEGVFQVEAVRVDDGRDGLAGDFVKEDEVWLHGAPVGGDVIPVGYAQSVYRSA